MTNRMLLVMAAAVIVSVPAWAFHDGGVAHCNGCHTMHNMENGQLVDPESPNGNPWLLRDASPSDVCLGCHATSLGAVYAGDCATGPPAERGGGNFIFLDCVNINDGHAGASNPIDGEAAGHSIDAPGFGLATDSVLTQSPGGSFPSFVLACTSCHDPHGTSAFRLLYGSGRVVNGFFNFTADAPTATGIGLFGPGEGPTNHTAYNGGMSAWCGNCHGAFHQSTTVLRHPSGETIGGTIATNYNLYNGSADLTGGAPGTAYLPQVPFEDSNTATYTTTSTQGPTATSQVSCITCHRAHASSAPDAGRWDFDVTFLEEDGLESGSFPLPNPYAGDTTAQRSLCNKCHVQDIFDELINDADL